MSNCQALSTEVSWFKQIVMDKGGLSTSIMECLFNGSDAGPCSGYNLSHSVFGQVPVPAQSAESEVVPSGSVSILFKFGDQKV